MYFICLYIYSNLLQVNPFYLLVHLFLIALEFVMICFQLSKKKCFWNYTGKISSKHIEVGFCFDHFDGGNAMVELDFNFDARS